MNNYETNNLFITLLIISLDDIRERPLPSSVPRLLRPDVERAANNDTGLYRHQLVASVYVVFDFFKAPSFY